MTQVAFALAAFMFAGDLGAEADIRGGWSWRSVKPYDGDCILSGSLTVEREDGRLTGRLHTTETCKGRTTEAQQTCGLERSGPSLSVLCTVDTVTPRAMTPFYQADDFRLTIIDDARMEGLLISADVADVIFTREMELTA